LKNTAIPSSLLKEGTHCITNRISIRTRRRARSLHGSIWQLLRRQGTANPVNYNCNSLIHCTDIISKAERALELDIMLKVIGNLAAP
jgi:hypothetical protein